ncbi:MAG TPA: type II secretion system protein [Candidatus Faecisoma merdavium]|nr:type II secretion system protein [Candidatus Faecisoma merdavium]
MKKNAFTLVELIAVIVLLCIIVLISFPALTNVIKGGEEKNKEEALNTIYMAAENYLMANYEKYFINNTGDTAYIYITDLINNNYLNADTINPNNDSSFSSKDVVKITRNEDGTFKYELEYVKTLIETLLEQYNESNTTGLVKDSINSNLYYYTGTNEEVSNNFLWYGGHQWRVLEFDTNENSITLISQQPLTAIYSANSVWTTQSAYESSYINTWLNDYFYNSLDSTIKNNIIDNTFNVGIYTDVDEIITKQKVGLLDEEQYKRAGSNESYLNIGNIFGLANRESSSSMRFVSNIGNILNDVVSLSHGIRPVIKISDITITEGNGSLENSYCYKNKSTNTNNVQVGEYINVPYNGSDNACGSDNMCTFRVISKNNDSIKVVLNGLLPKKSAWATDASDNITTSDLVYTNVLNGFIANIDSKYITTGKYGVGMYSIGGNYTVPQNTTITANVGLPTVGEMFSGNDINMAVPKDGAKTFVDVNTIENPTVSSDYWTMNRYRMNYVLGNAAGGWLVDGYYDFMNYSLASGIRPTIYLKNNLSFTGGNGTAQNPYTLN